jgi:hypothetical protein
MAAAIEHFRLSAKRETVLSVCFCAFPATKPVPASAELPAAMAKRCDLP